MSTVLLLVASNVFMTLAWYGHLRFKSVPLWQAIVASWLIAFFEYCLQVPANRWGHSRFSASQLKIMQEAITLAVFIAFAMLYFRDYPRWNYLAAYALIVAAVAVAFIPGCAASVRESERAHAAERLRIASAESGKAINSLFAEVAAMAAGKQDEPASASEPADEAAHAEPVGSK